MPRANRTGDDVALGALRARRDAAADDRPAKIALAPQPDGFIDAFVHIHTGAEHEQEIGGLQDRDNQMFRVDRGNLGLGRQSRASVSHVGLA